VRETYGLPREVPLVVRLLIVMVLTGIPLPLIWWLAAPLSAGVVAVLAFFELAIVFGGVWRVLTARAFNSLPDRRPVSPPSLRPLDPPGTPPAQSAQPEEISTGGPRQAVAPKAGDARERVLVVASEPPSAQLLREALSSHEADDLEVLVVAPALHQSTLRFWLSDADEAIRRAQDVQAVTVDELHDQRVAATGDTADSDVTQAVQDALVTFPADRILLFVHPLRDERPHEHVDVDALASMAHATVERHEIAP
jgi:hypothetical protein